MTDEQLSEEEGRDLIRRGVRAVVEARARDSADPTPFLTAWIAGYEYESTDTVGNNTTSGGSIAANHQSAHLSRGMAMALVDDWKPGR